jgi:hypothetical protein
MFKRPMSWVKGCSERMLLGGGEETLPGAAGSGPCGGVLDVLSSPMPW